MTETDRIWKVIRDNKSDMGALENEFKKLKDKISKLEEKEANSFKSLGYAHEKIKKLEKQLSGHETRITRQEKSVIVVLGGKE